MFRNTITEVNEFLGHYYEMYEVKTRHYI